MATMEGTPNNRDQDQRNSIVKTPHSGMSSSLKERLKKCGRYHPATPTSSRQMTPTSSLHSTVKTATHSLGVSSPRHQSTPTTCCNPAISDDGRSPTGLRRTLPQPRNILKEKSVLSNSYDIRKVNLNSELKTQTNNKTSMVISEKGKSVQFDPDATCDKICTDPEDPYNSSQLVNLPLLNTKAFVTDLIEKDRSPAENEDKLSLDKESVAQGYGTENGEDLREAKERLTAELLQQKEVLRKLHMVKTYRAKHDLQELQGLIDKWRCACRQAVLDLHQLTSDARPSLTHLIQQLGIDHQLVGYNEEDESFEED